MNILLTGGFGFIGSNLVRFLRKNRPDWTLYNLDLLTYAGNPDNLADLSDDPRHIFVHGDICDAVLVDRLIKQHAIEQIVHLAAESHVDRSIHAPLDFVRTNVTGTAVLLEAARKHALKRFVMVSTDEVYGSLGANDFFKEESPIRPSSPYSASKAGADMLALAYHHTYKLDVVITRCSNNYGPYQFPEKLIPLMLVNALQNKRLPVYGDGAQVRDWLHVEDHCSGIVTVLEKGRAGEVYNIGANQERKNIELVKTLLGILGRPETLIEHVVDRPGHDRRYATDASKIRTELGWTPRFLFDEGLAETVRWYLDHPNWCERILSGAYRQH